MKYIEKFYPLVLSVVFTIIMHFANINSIVNMKDIILSVITFVSILIGFLTTMLSVLTSAMDNSIMKYLKEEGKLKELYLFLVMPILIGFLLIIVCLMFIPICEVSNYKSYPNYYCLSFIFMWFMLGCIRAILFFMLLLNKFADKDINNDDVEDDDLDLTNSFNTDEEE